MGRRGIKEKDGGVNLRSIEGTFVNDTMYPQYNCNMLINKKILKRVK
jgi:hypothetical protein